MLLTPNGKPAGNMDRTMLLSLWTKQLFLEGKHRKICIAGIGKPTYPLSSKTAMTAASYWFCIAVRAFLAGLALKVLKFLPFFSSLNMTSFFSSAIDYGHPQGELVARKKMARALNTWYGKCLKIKAENILFTVGGSTALHVAFNVINRKLPYGRILTQFPYYTPRE